MCVFVHAGVCASPAILAVPHLPGLLRCGAASSTSTFFFCFLARANCLTKCSADLDSTTVKLVFHFAKDLVLLHPLCTLAGDDIHNLPRSPGSDSPCRSSSCRSVGAPRRPWTLRWRCSRWTDAVVPHWPRKSMGLAVICKCTTACSAAWLSRCIWTPGPGVSEFSAGIIPPVCIK